MESPRCDPAGAPHRPESTAAEAAVSGSDLPAAEAVPRAPDHAGSIGAWPLDAVVVVQRVVSHRLGRSCTDAEDVCAQAMLQLTERLHERPNDGVPGSIQDFANYVATLAHHVCDHYVRAKYPLRWQLRNRIRYALEHDSRFALWKTDEGVWLCGRAGWHSAPRGVLPDEALISIANERRLRDLLLEVFDLSGGSLELANVVDLAASVWKIPQSARDETATLEAIPDHRPPADVVLDERRNAERVWRQIKDLPARQRQALLLNLKDDAIRMFVLTGTASLGAIAEAVDMSVEALASVWNDLPLADNAIAARLGCTRQQVINLRMAARKRLAHRLFQWS